MRRTALWRVVWAVATFALVEFVVCSLSAMPALALWLLLPRIAGTGLRWQILLFGSAIVPAYVVFAIVLMIVSPMVMRMVGWRTPNNAEMPIANMDWPLLDWARYAMANHVVRLVAGSLFRASPLWTLHLRLAGAQVGKRVYVNSLEINDYNLLEFGDDVVIGGGVHLSGHTVEGGFARTAKVRLGRNTTVGLGSVVEIGVEAGPNCRIGALTFVPKHAKLEGNAVYAGIPAKRIG